MPLQSFLVSLKEQNQAVAVIRILPAADHSSKSIISMDKKYIRHFREILQDLRQGDYISKTMLPAVMALAWLNVIHCWKLKKIKRYRLLSLLKSLSLYKSTVSRTVDGLVHMNMVERVIPEENRRKAMINLSGKRPTSMQNDQLYQRYLHQQCAERFFSR